MSKYQTLRKNLFNTFDYNKFSTETLDAKTKEKELVDKSTFF